MIEAIAFDLGRVLFDFDYAIALRRLKGRINAPHAQVIEELFYKNFALEFEKGLVSGRKFYEKFKNNNYNSSNCLNSRRHFSFYC